MTKNPTSTASHITRRGLLLGATASTLAGCSPTSQEEERLALLAKLQIKGPALLYIASADCVADSPHNVEHLARIAARVSLPMFQIDITPLVRKTIDGGLIGGLMTPKREAYPGEYRYISDPKTAYNQDTIDKARTLGFSAVNSASHSGNVMLINAEGKILVERNSRENVNESIVQFQRALSAEQSRTGASR